MIVIITIKRNKAQYQRLPNMKLSLTLSLTLVIFTSHSKCEGCSTFGIVSSKPHLSQSTTKTDVNTLQQTSISTETLPLVLKQHTEEALILTEYSRKEANKEAHANRNGASNDTKIFRKDLFQEFQAYRKEAHQEAQANRKRRSQ